MASLPYPDKPANGQAPDATPLLANFLALLAAINAFDGSAVNTKTIVENGLADMVNPRLRDSGWQAPFVESGGWTASFSGLGWTMPSGIANYAGYRNNFTGAAYTVAINNDTYYSVTQTGAVNTPQAVANGAAIPTLAANSQWLAKVISGASAITSIQDLRNLSPLNGAGLVKTLTNAGTAGGSMSYLNLGGIKLLWGATAIITIPTSTTQNNVVTFPASFYTTPQTVVFSMIPGSSSQQFLYNGGLTATQLTISMSQSTGGTTTQIAHYFVIGT